VSKYHRALVDIESISLSSDALDCSVVAGIRRPDTCRLEY
jgi:hypothetical protein